MQNTVFSYIVQKRLSQENENIATEALAFILRYHKAAQDGMLKLLRGIDPKMPPIWFRTQQAKDESRPDMRGCDADDNTRVYVENKFRAGLTENQPVSYLRKLGACTQPTILLVVGPEDRKDWLWQALNERLAGEKISATNGTVAGIFRFATTSIGPILALTSWESLIDALEIEVADDKSARIDLLQLQSLCAAAESDDFKPISLEAISDQRTPAFILQLSDIIEGAVKKTDESILSIKNPLEKDPKKPTKGRLVPTHTWERVGRYVCFPCASAVGAWFGTEFTLWKKQGCTPLWLVFEDNDWQRGAEVWNVLESWASRNSIPAVWRDNECAFGIELQTGEDEEVVIASVSKQLEEIGTELSNKLAKRK